MATSTIILPITAAVTGDGSSGNEGPALQRVKSSAAAPSPFWLQAAFDASTAERVMWAFRMPADYFDTPELKVQFKMASATSGDVMFGGRVAAYTPTSDTDDADATAFGTVNTVTVTVPGTTAGRIAEASISLTNNDSLSANDWAVIYLSREAANGSDTASGDCEVVAVSLEYQTN